MHQEMTLCVDEEGVGERVLPEVNDLAEERIERNVDACYTVEDSGDDDWETHGRHQTCRH